MTWESEEGIISLVSSSLILRFTTEEMGATPSPTMALSDATAAQGEHDVSCTDITV